MWSTSATDDGGGGAGSLRDDDNAEDRFEPSLFAEFSPPSQWPGDVHTAFLAANLLLLYLNLARLSFTPINDARPLPITDDDDDRDDRDNDDDNK